LYSEAVRGELNSGQHPNCFHILFCFSRNIVPLGFCCGGFSSTAGYVPGNEAHLLSHLSDFCYFPVVPCRKVLLVFIQTTRKVFQLLLSKPFGFDSGRK
jgi:hypothetical protein